jgi:hypothetical protein
MRDVRGLREKGEKKEREQIDDGKGKRRNRAELKEG